MSSHHPSNIFPAVAAGGVATAVVVVPTTPPFHHQQPGMKGAPRHHHQQQQENLNHHRRQSTTSSKKKQPFSPPDSLNHHSKSSITSNATTMSPMMPIMPRGGPTSPPPYPNPMMMSVRQHHQMVLKQMMRQNNHHNHQHQLSPSNNNQQVQQQQPQPQPQPPSRKSHHPADSLHALFIPPKSPIIASPTRNNNNNNNIGKKKVVERKNNMNHHRKATVAKKKIKKKQNRRKNSGDFQITAGGLPTNNSSNNERQKKRTDIDDDSTTFTTSLLAAKKKPPSSQVSTKTPPPPPPPPNTKDDKVVRQKHHQHSRQISPLNNGFHNNTTNGVEQQPSSSSSSSCSTMNHKSDAQQQQQQNQYHQQLHHRQTKQQHQQQQKSTTTTTSPHHQVHNTTTMNDVEDGISNDTVDKERSGCDESIDRALPGSNAPPKKKKPKKKKKKASKDFLPPMVITAIATANKSSISSNGNKEKEGTALSSSSSMIPQPATTKTTVMKGENKNNLVTKQTTTSTVTTEMSISINSKSSTTAECKAAKTTVAEDDAASASAAAAATRRSRKRVKIRQKKEQSIDCPLQQGPTPPAAAAAAGAAPAPAAETKSTKMIAPPSSKMKKQQTNLNSSGPASNNVAPVPKPKKQQITTDDLLLQPATKPAPRLGEGGLSSIHNPSGTTGNAGSNKDDTLQKISMVEKSTTGNNNNKTGQITPVSTIEKTTLDEKRSRSSSVSLVTTTALLAGAKGPSTSPSPNSRQQNEKWSQPPSPAAATGQSAPLSAKAESAVHLPTTDNCSIDNTSHTTATLVVAAAATAKSNADKDSCTTNTAAEVVVDPTINDLQVFVSPEEKEEIERDYDQHLRDLKGKKQILLYQRRQGKEGVHDGQYMMLIAKSRFIVVDYSIIPTKFDIEYAKNQKPPIHFPPGAGTKQCRKKGCEKVGVPVLLYDSEPNSSASITCGYFKGRYCVTCFKEKERSRRDRKIQRKNAPATTMTPNEGPLLNHAQQQQQQYDQASEGNLLPSNESIMPPPPPPPPTLPSSPILTAGTSEENLNSIPVGQRLFLLEEENEVKSQSQQEVQQQDATVEGESTSAMIQDTASTSDASRTKASSQETQQQLPLQQEQHQKEQVEAILNSMIRANADLPDQDADSTDRFEENQQKMDDPSQQIHATPKVGPSSPSPSPSPPSAEAAEALLLARELVLPARVGTNQRHVQEPRDRVVDEKGRRLLSAFFNDDKNIDIEDDETNLHAILRYKEIEEDLKNHLGVGFDGKFFQRRPGVEFVNDGQCLVLLRSKTKKYRSLLLDYSIVPTDADIGYAQHQPYIMIPMGAGVTRCGEPGCDKVGVPVVLDDSQPNEPETCYTKSPTCFTCLKKLFKYTPKSKDTAILTIASQQEPKKKSDNILIGISKATTEKKPQSGSQMSDGTTKATTTKGVNSPKRKKKSECRSNGTAQTTAKFTTHEKQKKESGQICNGNKETVDFNSASEGPLQVGYSPEEFEEDFNKIDVNENFFQRRPGKEGVNDGQCLVKLKGYTGGHRCIVIDYTIIPTQSDIQYAERHPHVKILEGAGTQTCKRKECDKVGVPVVLYDSHPNANAGYINAGYCFACQRAVYARQYEYDKKRNRGRRSEVGIADKKAVVAGQSNVAGDLNGPHEEYSKHIEEENMDIEEESSDIDCSVSDEDSKSDEEEQEDETAGGDGHHSLEAGNVANTDYASYTSTRDPPLGPAVSPYTFDQFMDLCTLKMSKSEKKSTFQSYIIGTIPGVELPDPYDSFENVSSLLLRYGGWKRVEDHLNDDGGFLYYPPNTKLISLNESEFKLYLERQCAWEMNDEVQNHGNDESESEEEEEVSDDDQGVSDGDRDVSDDNNGDDDDESAVDGNSGDDRNDDDESDDDQDDDATGTLASSSSESSDDQESSTASSSSSSPARQPKARMGRKMRVEPKKHMVSEDKIPAIQTDDEMDRLLLKYLLGGSLDTQFTDWCRQHSAVLGDSFKSKQHPNYKTYKKACIRLQYFKKKGEVYYFPLVIQKLKDNPDYFDGYRTEHIIKAIAGWKAKWKRENPCFGPVGQSLSTKHKNENCPDCGCCLLCTLPPWCQNSLAHERRQESERNLKQELQRKSSSGRTIVPVKDEYEVSMASYAITNAVMQQEDPDHDEFYTFSNLMAFNRSCLNWLFMSGGILHNYKYVVGDKGGPDGEEGVDFFYNEADVVEYCRSNDYKRQYAKEYEEWVVNGRRNSKSRTLDSARDWASGLPSRKASNKRATSSNKVVDLCGNEEQMANSQSAKCVSATSLSANAEAEASQATATGNLTGTDYKSSTALGEVSTLSPTRPSTEDPGPTHVSTIDPAREENTIALGGDRDGGGGKSSSMIETTDSKEAASTTPDDEVDRLVLKYLAGGYKEVTCFAEWCRKNNKNDPSFKRYSMTRKRLAQYRSEGEAHYLSLIEQRLKDNPSYFDDDAHGVRDASPKEAEVLPATNAIIAKESAVTPLPVARTNSSPTSPPTSGERAIVAPPQIEQDEGNNITSASAANKITKMAALSLDGKVELKTPVRRSTRTIIPAQDPYGFSMAAYVTSATESTKTKPSQRKAARQTSSKPKRSRSKDAPLVSSPAEDSHAFNESEDFEEFEVDRLVLKYLHQGYLEFDIFADWCRVHSQVLGDSLKDPESDDFRRYTKAKNRLSRFKREEYYLHLIKERLKDDPEYFRDTDTPAELDRLILMYLAGGHKEVKFFADWCRKYPGTLGDSLNHPDHPSFKRYNTARRRLQKIRMEGEEYYMPLIKQMRIDKQELDDNGTDTEVEGLGDERDEDGSDSEEDEDGSDSEEDEDGSDSEEDEAERDEVDRLILKYLSREYSEDQTFADWCRQHVNVLGDSLKSKDHEDFIRYSKSSNRRDFFRKKGEEYYLDLIDQRLQEDPNYFDEANEQEESEQEESEQEESEQEESEQEESEQEESEQEEIDRLVLKYLAFGHAEVHTFAEWCRRYPNILGDSLKGSYFRKYYERARYRLFKFKKRGERYYMSLVEKRLKENPAYFESDGDVNWNRCTSSTTSSSSSTSSVPSTTMDENEFESDTEMDTTTEMDRLILKYLAGGHEDVKFFADWCRKYPDILGDSLNDTGHPSFKLYSKSKYRLNQFKREGDEYYSSLIERLLEDNPKYFDDDDDDEISSSDDGDEISSSSSDDDDEISWERDRLVLKFLAGRTSEVKFTDWCRKHVDVLGDSLKDNESKEFDDYYTAKKCLTRFRNKGKDYYMPLIEKRLEDNPGYFDDDYDDGCEQGDQSSSSTTSTTSASVTSNQTESDSEMVRLVLKYLAEGYSEVKHFADWCRKYPDILGDSLKSNDGPSLRRYNTARARLYKFKIKGEGHYMRLIEERLKDNPAYFDDNDDDDGHNDKDKSSRSSVSFSVEPAAASETRLEPSIPQVVSIKQTTALVSGPADDAERKMTQQSYSIRNSSSRNSTPAHATPVDDEGNEREEIDRLVLKYLAGVSSTVGSFEDWCRQHSQLLVDPLAPLGPQNKNLSTCNRFKQASKRLDHYKRKGKQFYLNLISQRLEGNPAYFHDDKIETPHPNDVLDIKDPVSHAGNQSFSKWIQAHKEQFDLATSEEEEATVVNNVISLVRNQNPPGRILQRDDGCWIEVDEQRAFRKVYEALGGERCQWTNQAKAEWKRQHPCIGTRIQFLKSGHKQGNCRDCNCCRICEPPPWCQTASNHQLFHLTDEAKEERKRKRQDLQRQREEELRKQKELKEARRRKKEESRKQKELEEAQRRKEESRKQKEAEEAQRRKEEKLRKQKELEEAQRRRKEELRKQKELEETQRRRKEESRKQKELEEAQRRKEDEERPQMLLENEWTDQARAEWKGQHPCLGTLGQLLKGGHHQGKCKGCNCCRICKSPPWCQTVSVHQRRHESPSSPQLETTAKTLETGGEIEDKKSKGPSSSGKNDAKKPVSSLKRYATEQSIPARSSRGRRVRPVNNQCYVSTASYATADPGSPAHGNGTETSEDRLDRGEAVVTIGNVPIASQDSSTFGVAAAQEIPDEYAALVEDLLWSEIEPEMNGAAHQEQPNMATTAAGAAIEDGIDHSMLADHQLADQEETTRTGTKNIIDEKTEETNHGQPHSSVFAGAITMTEHEDGLARMPLQPIEKDSEVDNTSLDCGPFSVSETFVEEESLVASTAAPETTKMHAFITSSTETSTTARTEAEADDTTCDAGLSRGSVTVTESEESSITPRAASAPARRTKTNTSLAAEAATTADLIQVDSTATHIGDKTAAPAETKTSSLPGDVEASSITQNVDKASPTQPMMDILERREEEDTISSYSSPPQDPESQPPSPQNSKVDGIIKASKQSDSLPSPEKLKQPSPRICKDDDCKHEQLAAFVQTEPVLSPSPDDDGTDGFKKEDRPGVTSPCQADSQQQRVPASPSDGCADGDKKTTENRQAVTGITEKSKEIASASPCDTHNTKIIEMKIPALSSSKSQEMGKDGPKHDVRRSKRAILPANDECEVSMASYAVRNAVVQGDKPSHDDFYTFHNLMPFNRACLDWLNMRGGMLHNHKYVVGELAGPDGIEGVDFFHEESEVLQYCRKNDYKTKYGKQYEQWIEDGKPNCKAWTKFDSIKDWTSKTPARKATINESPHVSRDADDEQVGKLQNTAQENSTFDVTPIAPQMMTADDAAQIEELLLSELGTELTGGSREEIGLALRDTQLLEGKAGPSLLPEQHLVDKKEGASKSESGNIAVEDKEDPSLLPLLPERHPADKEEEASKSESENILVKDKEEHQQKHLSSCGGDDTTTKQDYSSATEAFNEIAASLVASPAPVAPTKTNASTLVGSAAAASPTLADRIRQKANCKDSLSAYTFSEPNDSRNMTSDGHSTTDPPATAPLSHRDEDQKRKTTRKRKLDIESKETASSVSKKEKQSQSSSQQHENQDLQGKSHSRILKKSIDKKRASSVAKDDVCMANQSEVDRLVLEYLADGYSEVKFFTHWCRSHSSILGDPSQKDKDHPDYKRYLKAKKCKDNFKQKGEAYYMPMIQQRLEENPKYFSPSKAETAPTGKTILSKDDTGVDLSGSKSIGESSVTDPSAEAPNETFEEAMSITISTPSQKEGDRMTRKRKRNSDITIKETASPEAKKAAKTTKHYSSSNSSTTQKRQTPVQTSMKAGRNATVHSSTKRTDTKKNPSSSTFQSNMTSSLHQKAATRKPKSSAAPLKTTKKTSEKKKLNTERTVSMNQASRKCDDREKTILNPLPNDVLCGHGKGIYSHAGNKAFRELVRAHKEEFHLASTDERRVIVRKVMDLVQHKTPPGRFLEKVSEEDEKSNWAVAKEQKAVLKTHKALGKPDAGTKGQSKASQESDMLQLQSSRKNKGKKRKSVTAFPESNTESTKRQHKDAKQKDSPSSQPALPDTSCSPTSPQGNPAIDDVKELVVESRNQVLNNTDSQQQPEDALRQHIPADCSTGDVPASSSNKVSSRERQSDYSISISTRCDPNGVKGGKQKLVAATATLSKKKDANGLKPPSPQATSSSSHRKKEKQTSTIGNVRSSGRRRTINKKYQIDGNEEGTSMASYAITNAVRQANNPEYDEFYTFNNLMAFNRARLNWLYMSGGLCFNYKYVVGDKAGPINGRAGIDFFHEESEVVEYCRKNNYKHKYDKEYQEWVDSGEAGKKGWTKFDTVKDWHEFEQKKVPQTLKGTSRPR